MKLDIKTITILVLILVSSFSIWRWISSTNFSEEKIKILEKDFRELNRKRDSVDKKINLIKKEVLQLTKKDSILMKENESLIIKLEKSESQLSDLKNKWIQSVNNVTETKRKISKLEQNPNNREDDDLVQSLKNKLK